MQRVLRFAAAAFLAAGVSFSASSAEVVIGENGEFGGFTAKFTDVNGVRTRYYELGQGEPMVLVHGSGFTGTASANTWIPVLGLLSEKFHIYAPDKLASGMTGNPKSDDDLTIRGEVQHMVDFIKAMKLDKIHLVGQSRGGGLAFLLAVDHPELIKTLILVDSSTAAPPAGDDRSNRRQNLTAHCPREPWTERWPCQTASWYYDKSAVTEDLVQAALYMANLPKAQETEARMTPERAQRNSVVTSEMNHNAYHRILTENVLQMPVLVYWGKNDPSVLPTQAEALYNIIAETNPYARLSYINRAGHFHYREHPREFTHTVASFIDYWTTDGAEVMKADALKPKQQRQRVQD